MTVDADQVVQGGVRYPHYLKDLSHVPEISLNGALSDGSTACCQDSHADPLRKDLEVGDWVRKASEVGGKGEPLREVQTFAPGGVAGLGAGCANTALLDPPRSSVLIMRVTESVGG